MSVYTNNIYISDLDKYVILGEDQRVDNIAYLQAYGGVQFVQETRDGELKSFSVSAVKDGKGYYRVTNSEKRIVDDIKDADIKIFDALSGAESDLKELEYCPEILIALLKRMKMDRAFLESYGGQGWNVPLILANSYAKDGKFASAKSVQLFAGNQSRTELLTTENVQFLAEEMGLPYEYVSFVLIPVKGKRISPEHIENFLNATGRI